MAHGRRITDDTTFSSEVSSMIYNDGNEEVRLNMNDFRRISPKQGLCVEYVHKTYKTIKKYVTADAVRIVRHIGLDNSILLAEYRNGAWENVNSNVSIKNLAA